MTVLFNFLTDQYPVQQAILEDYVAQWSEFAVPKKTMLTTSGQREQYLYFVTKGIQKSYYLYDGKEHIMFFAYPPSFSGVVESFFTQTPSLYFLETISDSEFLRIPYSVHETYITRHREIERLFRIITESFLKAVIVRHHELLTFDAATRLKKFTARSPHLLQMVSQKDLASYLRIDPTNFSKMMNRIRI
jgi:CRP-like cAMP-binding protein